MSTSDNRTNFITRRYLVDRETQLTILGYTLFSSVVAVVLSGGIFLLFGISRAELTAEGDSRLKGLLIGAIVVCFVAVLVLALLGFVVSNRIAGPVFRLRKHMQGIAAGEEPKPVQFRKGDQFASLADDYNRVIDRLKQAEQNK